MSEIKKQDGVNTYKVESFLHKIVSMLTILVVFVLPFWSFMKLFNRVKISGKSHLTKARLPFLFVSNHVSLLDDAFVDTLLFMPRGFYDYKFIPYHTPEWKNFYVGPILSWIMNHVKCIPLTRGKGINQPGVQRIIDTLKAGNCVHIYPEGTRTRTGRLGEGKPGVGRIIYETKCSVIPCYHHGLDRVLPIGAKFPRPFNDITIVVGEPVTFERYFTQENNPQTWKAIADDLIHLIRGLRESWKR
jgi:monolysocardiolipin acyltransferase